MEENRVIATGSKNIPSYRLKKIERQKELHKKRKIILGCSLALLFLVFSTFGIFVISNIGLKYTSNGDGTCYVSDTGIFIQSDVEIPSEYKGMRVMGISYDAFWGRYNLKNITIPDSVIRIGEEAFADCEVLTSITVDANNPNYASLNGVLFNKEKTKLICYPAGKMGAYRISNDVTSIGEGAFHGCEGLTSITIPDSVTSIGDRAFFVCSSLTNIRFNGTKRQWNAISKGSSWNYKIPATEVICSDGKVYIG